MITGEVLLDGSHMNAAPWLTGLVGNRLSIRNCFFCGVGVVFTLLAILSILGVECRFCGITGIRLVYPFPLFLSLFGRFILAYVGGLLHSIIPAIEA